MTFIQVYMQKIINFFDILTYGIDLYGTQVCYNIWHTQSLFLKNNNNKNKTGFIVIIYSGVQKSDTTMKIFRWRNSEICVNLKKKLLY